MTEEILTLAKTLYSVAEEKEALLRLLAAAAEEELTARLREGVSPADCGGAFLCAAAWMAVADLMGAENAEDGGAAFTAGSVSVGSRSAGDALRMTEALRGQAERLMAPWLADDRFAFRGVNG